MKINITSKQDDNFQEYSDIKIPPYEPLDLFKLIEESDVLKQNIEAIATNTTLLGWSIRYKSDFDYNKSDDNLKKVAEKEWIKLENFYKYINPVLDFNQIVKQMVVDLESIGYCFLEVLEDSFGLPQQFEFCRALNIRLCKTDNTYCDVIQKRKDENGNEYNVSVKMRFKKFVQSVNMKKVYFKEYGDPRFMNYETGDYTTSHNGIYEATSLIYINYYCNFSDYGIPKWTGNVLSVLGNRSSEFLNYKYFEDGTMIPAAICVSGGKLTQESIEILRNGKGIDNAFKLLVLEAFAEKDALGDSANNVKIDIKSLADTNNEDALFQKYQLNNREKIRDSFRLPPLFTGASTDYTKATAEISKLVAEEQIFIPLRNFICNHINKLINKCLDISYCELYLKGAQTSDTAELANSLEPFIKAGSVTPNMLIDMLGSVINKELEPLPDEIGNIPFELLKIKYQSMLSNKDTSSDIDIKKSMNDVNILNDMLEEIKKLGAYDE